MTSTTTLPPITLLRPSALLIPSTAPLILEINIPIFRDDHAFPLTRALRPQVPHSWAIRPLRQYCDVDGEEYSPTVGTEVTYYTKLKAARRIVWLMDWMQGTKRSNAVSTAAMDIRDVSNLPQYFQLLRDQQQKLQDAQTLLIFSYIRSRAVPSA
ncbi:hypothetical protein N657DRAFT_674495 [Parathielavia appendiculata]|uniref:Uncharacterized protein n=1 Tax=Parathielavia appendiculata TaxID=2587402 RepID=A0AAN6TSP9_9PEZI|nr:hypothetical protein N657DRAFT_674495 [Parathielavia appendiculata]